MTELDKTRLGESADRVEKKAKDGVQSIPTFRDSADKKWPTNETKEWPVR